VSGGFVASVFYDSSSDFLEKPTLFRILAPSDVEGIVQKLSEEALIVQGSVLFPFPV
jgi:hypothetical protein